MWPHFLCTAIGAWLMAAPQVLGYGGAAEMNDHILGPLIVTFSCSAAFQSVRGLRWASAALGAWLLVAPLVLGYEHEPLINSMLAGGAVLVLSLIRGPITQRFAGGWSELWKRPGAPARAN